MLSYGLYFQRRHTQCDGYRWMETRRHEKRERRDEVSARGPRTCTRHGPVSRVPHKSRIIILARWKRIKSDFQCERPKFEEDAATLASVVPPCRPHRLLYLRT